MFVLMCYTTENLERIKKCKPIILQNVNIFGSTLTMVPLRLLLLLSKGLSIPNLIRSNIVSEVLLQLIYQHQSTLLKYLVCVFSLNDAKIIDKIETLNSIFSSCPCIQLFSYIFSKTYI